MDTDGGATERSGGEWLEPCQWARTGRCTLMNASSAKARYLTLLTLRNGRLVSEYNSAHPARDAAPAATSLSSSWISKILRR